MSWGGSRPHLRPPQSRPQAHVRIHTRTVLPVSEPGDSVIRPRSSAGPTCPSTGSGCFLRSRPSGTALIFSGWGAVTGVWVVLAPAWAVAAVRVRAALGGLWADGPVAGPVSVLLRGGEDEDQATQSLSTLIRTQRHTHPALVAMPTGLCCGVCVCVCICLFCLSLRSNHTLCAASQGALVTQYEGCVCVCVLTRHMGVRLSLTKLSLSRVSSAAFSSAQAFQAKLGLQPFPVASTQRPVVPGGLSKAHI